MADPTTMRRGSASTVMVVIAAVVGLLLVALGSTSPRPSIVEMQRGPTASVPVLPPPTASEILPSVEGLPPMPEVAPISLPTWLPDLLRAVVIIVIIAAVIWLIHRISQAMTKADFKQAKEATEGVELAEINEEEIADAVDQTVASLRRGIAVEGAIIECWRRLEEVAADTGIARRPAQTSQEFTVEVLGNSTVDAAAIENLAELYRQAMFSTHELTDDDRERAIDALEAVSAQLRVGR